MTDQEIADAARTAIKLWEMNRRADPKRQAIAKFLGIDPVLVTDEMIARVEQGFNTREPNMQQVPRTPRRRP